MYFESDTVKSECPVQIFRKRVGLPYLFYCLLSSENDQSTGHFQSFLSLFSSPLP